MASDGKVTISTALDNSGLKKGIKSTEGMLGGLSGVVRKLGFALAAVFGTAQLTAFAKEAIDLGSDLQEVQNVVDVTFGEMSGAVDAFAKNAIKQFGLSELAAKQYSSTMGAMLKSMGFGTETAAQMSMELAGLAGDMASFYNLESDDAFGKIRAGISGETEPLKQLGINLSAANLEQFALAQGTEKAYSAMTQQEQALLRYKYLLSVTADAQGDFTRTSDGWANQTRILSEQFNSLKASIGQGLINVLTPVISVLNTIISGLQVVADGFRKITALLFGKAGGAGEAMASTAQSVTEAADGAQALASGTEAAGKAAKKSLAGFDELNKLQGNSGGSGSSATSTGGISAGGIAVDTDVLVDDAVSPQIEGIVTKIQELLAPLRDIDFTPAIESFGRLGEAAGGLGKTIGDGLQWAWEHILVPLAEWTIEEAVPAAVDTLAAGFAAWNEVLKVLAPVAEEFWTEVLQPLGEWAGEQITGALTGIKDLFLKLAEVFEENGPEIEEIFENIGEVFSSVWEAVEPLLSDMESQFDQDFENIGKFIEDAVELGIEYLGDLTEFLADVFAGDWEGAWEDVEKIFEDTKEALITTIDLLLSDMGISLADIETAVSDTWTSIKKGATEIWDGIVSAIKEKINGLIGLINGMIAGVVDGINAVIGLLNAFSIDIPNWDGFGEYAGKKLGFDIGYVSTPQIPYLAQGAVLPANKPFLAMVGDQRHGTNVEAPLSTIQEAVALVMEDMTGGMMAGFEATVAVLKEILEAIYGIEIGDEVIAKAAQRYQEKMAIVKRGG